MKITRANAVKPHRLDKEMSEAVSKTRKLSTNNPFQTADNQREASQICNALSIALSVTAYQC